MSHFGASVEYALHVMVQLGTFTGEKSPSAKALAEFIGIPPAYLAKIMTQLEKAGLVEANEGKRGGYRLAREPQDITFLDVADAVEGGKALFECTEVRLRCVLYGGKPPKPTGLCAIHAVMRAAEQHMRAHLAATTLADILRPLQAKSHPITSDAVQKWFEDRATNPITRSKLPQRKNSGE